ncbi:MAG: hypothetical protein WC505_08160 [Patescibacteria group bacterium]
MKNTLKKFTTGSIIFGSLALGSLGLAGNAFADDPAFADPGVTVTTGGLNGGSTSPARTGDLGIVRASLKAVPKIAQGYVTLCGTDAAGGYGHALDKACG